MSDVEPDEDVDDANRVDDADNTEELSDDDPAATAADVLEYVVRSLVEDPDAVEIEVDDRGRRTRLDVRVGDGDMGRVIGKRGRVAQSIRTVVRAAAARDELEVDIEFVD